MFKKSPVSIGVALALGGVAALPAFAQDQTQRVEITGSAIKRVNAETALPVTVMKVDDLKEAGFTTVQDIINTLSVNQSSIGTSAAVGGLTGGAAFANLRGLGANRSLVLLNGRRIANQAIGGAGDSSAPDLNSIPLAAIERIEVLRDGASSLYGTDAMGGVINFVTKKDYTGAELMGLYNRPQHDGGKSYEASAGFGAGDLNKDKWNVFGFIDAQHQDVLTTPQRPQFATSDKTSPTGFPGSWSQGGLSASPFAPGCTQQYQAPSGGVTCAYKYWNWVDLVPKTDRVNGMLKGTIALSADTQLNLEYTAAKTKVWTNIAPVPEGALSINPGTKYYPGNGIIPGPTADQLAGGPFDPTQPVKVRWRAIPAGPRADENDTFQQRFLASLEGNVAGWDYNTAFTYNKVKTTENLTGGYVNDAVIKNAVMIGDLNPFTSTLSDAEQSIVTGALAKGKQFDAKGEVSSLDFRGSRELSDWFGSGRNSALALGAEVRHEKYTQIANTAFASQVVSSTGFDPNTDNEGQRNVWAVYGELNMPVTKALEVTGSLRYDKYPHFGSTWNPKLSAKYAPGDSWALRGAASTGFRAPSLYEQFAAQTFTNTANNWNDPVRCPNGNPIPGAARSDNCAVQFMSLTGGNPNLKPEKSRNFTFGIVLSPVKEFDATIDYWFVKLTDTIGALSDATVFGDPATYASHFVRSTNPAGTLATDGSLCNTAANPGPECGYVVLLNDNLGGVLTDGIDISANYRLRTEVGDWLFGIQETYTHRYQFQTEKNGPWFNSVGEYAGTPTITGGGPIFRNQWTITANWHWGPWGAGLINHYRSGYLDQDIGQTPINDVSSYSTWDLFGTWSPTKQFTLGLGVRNLTDRLPPVTVQSATFQVGYDPRFADPFLRSYYVRASYKF